MGTTKRRTPATAVLAAAAATALSACGSSAAAHDSSPGGSGAGPVRVVASTSVYGDIAEQIGGGDVDVTSIINDPSQDPHSFEADARTQLALARADVVIKNGGGYDDFVTAMRKSVEAKGTVIDAVTVSGHQAAKGAGLNEHVWYDFRSVERIVTRLVHDLSAADPSTASTFRANAMRFTGKLKSLEATEESIRATHSGAGVAISEPVPLYLLQACGLHNVTPPEFSAAIEEGDGVSVQVLNATLELFREGQVALLVYNEQTSGQETARVRAAAEAADVPVVPVTETLPDGLDYVSWMTGNLEAIKAALG